MSEPSEKESADAKRPAIPFVRHLGIIVEKWNEDNVVLIADVKDEHCNYSGLPHGGFIATMLDSATALAGVYTSSSDRVRRALTLSLNINFIGQAQTRRLKAVGKLTARGRKIYYSQAHVEDMEGNRVASAQGVFRYRSGSESD